MMREYAWLNILVNIFLKLLPDIKAIKIRIITDKIKMGELLQMLDLHLVGLEHRIIKQTLVEL
jgi:hypothetical protein